MAPAAMKWSGPFSLLLVLWLTAPSSQRVVPPGAVTSPAGEEALSAAQATEEDNSTRSLLVELDDEEKEEKSGRTTMTTTTTGLTTSSAPPLRIEIDMEETLENVTGSPQGSTEPAWHPYLIKISSGTATPGTPEPATTQLPTLMEETIVMKVPESSSENESSTATASTQLTIEELSPSTAPPAAQASEASTSVLLMLESQPEPERQHLQEQGGPKKKRQKQHTEEGEPEKPKPQTPSRKQKFAPPVKKSKSKPVFGNDTKPHSLLPPVAKASSGNVSNAPQVFLVIKEVDRNSTALQQERELPVAIQIIDTSTKGAGTSVPGTSVKSTDNVTSASGNSIKTDTITKAPGPSLQGIVTNSNATGTSIMDTGNIMKTTSIQDMVTSFSMKDSDIVTKAPDISAQDIVTGATTRHIGITEIGTSTPGIILMDADPVTRAPDISITDIDTVSSTPSINTNEMVTSTKDTNTDVDNESEVDDTIISISDKGISFTDIVTRVTVPEPHFKELYFDQLVDHFSFNSHQKLYRQRYLLTDQFWAKSFGPIFLYTGNEGDIWDFANSSRFIIELASEQQAMVIFAEHRYYGKSLPFGKKSYEKSNIEFLTVEQAVADYVVLITKLKVDLDAKNCAVIAFGGSYGGMLSAYMRIKYPNVVDGALASSAPVVSTANLGDSRQFFHDVTKDFERNSPDCVLTIRKGFQELESLAQQQAWSKITSKLSLCKSVKSKKEVDHLYGWARNAFTYLAMFNYPYKTEVGLHFPAKPVDVACRYILKKSDHIEGLLDILGMFYNSTGNKKCFDIYTEYIHCSDPTGCGLGAASQAWDFQACTEINLLYESNNDTDMFPAIPFTEAMRKSYCHSKWGVYPSPEWLKIQYWGDDYKAASNIIFSNGDLDPWANGGRELHII
ncbi:dipeptidyl peptidase 2 isoform X2 [Carcharodon carcharias]|uniref:dipeptidyl peptidase 2 isoform X2 n=1 Tax=Carcharodon carcharias TaxID=13397 RepID=UPI001B7F0735|nr:dipeptidyl peptidase 2 isoform X2 [Carcharodon carcharias]